MKKLRILLLLIVPLAYFPLKRMGKRIHDMLTNPATQRQIRRRSVIGSCTLLGVLLVFACIPLPRNVTAIGQVRFQQERVVRTAVAGRIIQAVSEGAQVIQGDLIVQLRNDELSRRLAHLREEQIQLKLQIEELQAIRPTDPDAASKIATLQEQLAGVKRELKSQQLDVERLQIVAMEAGLVVAPPAKLSSDQSGERHATEAQDATSQAQLNEWTGTPLQLENRGCYLERGVVVCQLGDPNRKSVMAKVEPASIEQLAIGQPVRLRFRESTTRGRVARISRLNPQTQSELMQLNQDREASADPTTSWYSVLIELEQPDLEQPIGMHCRVSIRVSSASLTQRFGRWLERTFRLRA